MVKKFFIELFVFLTVIALVGCTDKKVSKPKKIEKVKEDKITTIMKDMSLEEKIAQMLILVYKSDTVDDDLISLLQETSPGGFILMKENITTYEKTRKFTDDLKRNSKHPLIISIDQEGGNVQRLNNLSDVKPTNIPFMYDLGQKKDTNLAYDTGKVMALELRSIGVNVDFAPDIDVYSNPNNTVIGRRSFGSDAEVVSMMATSLAKGLEDNKVVPAYKHFPGHGDTDVDSHVSLPILNKGYDDLDSLDFVPFKKAVEEKAKMIMVGHIAVPSITSDNTPASLSKQIIDILKNDLNYDGLIVTDALNMGALTENYTNEEIYTRAIEAGCDLLLMPSSSKEATEIIKNNISEERIDESVRKILKFKYDYLEEDNSVDSSYLGSEEHKNIISKITG